MMGAFAWKNRGVAAADLNGVTGRSHYPSGARVLVVLMELHVPAWEFKFRAPPEPYEQVASSVSYSWSRA